MKFVIEGKEYDVEAGVEKAELYTLFELKSKYGIGVKSLVAQAKKFGEITDPLDLLDDEEGFQSFLAIIWLARRHAGEKLTMEEANSIPLNELQIVADEDEETPDPKELTASAPDEKPAQT